MVIITKKHLTISIDEELLEKSKNQIPNIGAFVEYCLKNYLGEIEGLVPTWKQQELIDTIKKCQLELYLMNEKNNIEENMKKAQLEEINVVWRKLYKEYRIRKNNDPKHLEDAAEKLEVSVQELVDILDVTYAYSYRDNIDITNWFEVYEKYGYGDSQD